MKVRIKNIPSNVKTGTQLDYALVDRNSLFLKKETSTDENAAKQTISAVPREEANIEAEGGETVLGDINNDGFLEHNTIVGKRHSEGGVPLNVAPGSFIFSDTKKMRIKDPEILKYFGMSSNKSGYTPAQIAKKYKINNFMQTVKDEKADKFAKDTAQLMLQNNMQKLSELALIQESMKGFPEGIPAIAQSAAAGLTGLDEAEYGGILTKAQNGGGMKLSVADAERLYKKALKSGNTDEMKKAIKTIEDYKNSAWYSWGWVPGSDEHDFEGFQNSLNLEIKKRANAQNEAKSLKNLDDFYRNFKSTAYTFTKERDKLIQGLPSKLTPEQASQYEDLLNAHNKILKYKLNPESRTSKNYTPPTDIGALELLSNSEKRLSKLNELNSILSGSGSQGSLQTTGKKIRLGETPQVQPVIKKKEQQPAPSQTQPQQVPVTTSKKRTTVQRPEAPLDLNGVKVGDKPVEFDPNLKYGGEYQQGGATGDEIVGYVLGASGKVYAKYASGAVAQTDSTKYMSYDKSRKAFRMELPNNLSFKEKQNIASNITAQGFKGVVQSANARMNPQDYYDGFYAGLQPQDFEDKLVRENYGDETADSLSELGKRRKAFDILGLKVPLAKMADAKSLYSKEFIRDTFYPAFTKALPADTYRPEMGNDVMFGLEHLDAYKLPKKQAPAEEQYQEPDIVVNPIQPEEDIQNSRGWTRNATLNALNSFAGKRYHGKPYLPNVNFDTFGYVLESPAQELANIASSENMAYQEASNSLNGNVAFAAMQGVRGKSLEAAANTLAGVNNRNVQTVNAANAANTQIKNTEADLNAKYRYQFNEDVNTLGQQEVNTDNAYRSNVIKSVIKANQEEENLDYLKKMFPQVGINNWNRSIGFSGKGRNPFAPDTYMNPAGNQQANSKGFSSGYDYNTINAVAGKVYTDAYNSNLGVMGHEKAREYASKMALSAANRQMATPYTGTSGNNYMADFANLYNGITPDYLED